MVILGVHQNASQLQAGKKKGWSIFRGSAVIKRTGPFFVPRTKTLDLLFFRHIFDKLQLQLADHKENARVAKGTEIPVPIPVFHRVISRTAKVFGIKGIANACDYNNSKGEVRWSEFVDLWRSSNLEYELSYFERFFLTFEDSLSCILASVISKVILLMIALSTLCFVLSTVPSLRAEPLTNPSNPDEWLEPADNRTLEHIETVCVFIFTFEYIVRVSTCGFARMELLNQERLLNAICDEEPRLWSTPAQRVLAFFVSPANVVDLVAIAPFWVETFMSYAPKGLLVLRVMRLMRIFRVIRVAKYTEAAVLILKTVVASTHVLSVLAINFVLGSIVFGALMHNVEGGRWNSTERLYERHVDRVWVDGQWQDIWKPTPFTSIPATFWWCFVTCLTVGYGEVIPTTWIGKVLGIVVACWGVIMMAPPVGVIGNNFAEFYMQMIEDKIAIAAKEKLERDIVEATLLFVDPPRRRSRLRVEVFDDSGVDGVDGNQCLSSCEFLGVASVNLNMPVDQIYRRREVLELEADFNKAQRIATGTLTLEYEWRPRSLIGKEESSGANASAEAEVTAISTLTSSATTKSTMSPAQPDTTTTSKSSSHAALDGELTLRILRANKLLNLDWKANTSPDAFCVAQVFVQNPDARGELVPELWHTNVVRASRNPEWSAERLFRFEPCGPDFKIYDPNVHGSLDAVATYYAQHGSLHGFVPRGVPRPVKAAEASDSTMWAQNIKGNEMAWAVTNGPPATKAEKLRKLKATIAELRVKLEENLRTHADSLSEPGPEPVVEEL